MTSPWNRSFNGSWQDLRNENIAKSERADLLFAVRQMAIAIAVAAVIAVMMHSCTDAIVRQAEIDQQYAPKLYVEQTYAQPAAFHKAYPTAEQMDSLHALQKVAEVAK